MDGRNHSGVDYAASVGTPVQAAAAGSVTYAGNRVGSGYGIVVYLDHGSGISSRYAHLSGTNVTVGDRLSAGDVLGYVGSTGDSTGPHLHFELLRDGRKINPEPYLSGSQTVPVSNVQPANNPVVPDSLEALGTIFQWLTDPMRWLRVGLFVLGVALLAGGALYLTGRSIL